MANTTNLDLVKPAGTDHALISVINSNMDKIDTYAGTTNTAIDKVVKAKDLGTFSTVSGLSALLDTELSGMNANSVLTIRVQASATVGLFTNNAVYIGTIYKSGLDTYAHVMLYPNVSILPITGVKLSGTWSFDNLETKETVDTKLGFVKKSIAANSSGTFTFGASYASTILVFQAYSNTQQGLYILSRAAGTLITTVVKSSDALALSMDANGVVTMTSASGSGTTALLIPIVSTIS